MVRFPFRGEAFTLRWGSMSRIRRSVSVSSRRRAPSKSVCPRRRQVSEAIRSAGVSRLSDLARSGLGAFPRVECIRGRFGRGYFSMTSGAPYVARASGREFKPQVDASGRPRTAWFRGTLGETGHRRANVPSMRTRHRAMWLRSQTRSLAMAADPTVDRRGRPTRRTCHWNVVPRCSESVDSA